MKNAIQSLQERYVSAIVIIMLIMVPFASSAQDTPPAFVPSHSQKAVRTSTDVILVALPVAAATAVIAQKDWDGLKEGAYSAAATLGATLILKAAIREDRPDHSNRHSFPSGHSSITFASATFIGQRYGWKWGAPACALATYTAWGRVYGRKHHWWDVVAGAAIGTASSLVFTHPYLRQHEAAIVPVATDTSIGLAASFSF